MANIGESRTARLARERLEAIKNFIPVRDSVRESQAQQQAKVEFAMGAEELFKPVTTATEKAATVTKEALLGETGILPTLKKTAEQTEKIAARTKQTKKILRGLPTEIVAATPQQQEGAVAATPQQQKEVGFIIYFTENGIKQLKNIQSLKQDELNDFGVFAAASYPSGKIF